jgi:TolB-like protein
MKFLSVLLFFAAFCPAAVAGGSISKLEAASEKLISNYSPEKSGKTGIAIPPLTCDGNLAKMQVGFAVSEILSRKFVASPKFVVVEREALDKVLKEQKLAASGSVSEETAAAFGKLTGARVLLLGNVLKINGKYQVNARLVNSETGAVLDSAYAEVEAAAFESEAKPYLNLVPEEQALSLYFLYNFRNNANDLAATTNNMPGHTVVSSPQSFNLAMAGGGIRYFPAKKLIFDLSVMGSGSKSEAGDIAHTSGASNWAESYSVGVFSYRGLLGLEFKPSLALRLSPAIGATMYSFSGGVATSYSTLTAQLRGEYRPQARFGVSMSVCYDFNAKAAIHQDDDSSDSYPSKRARLNRLSFEPALSFYF